MTEREGLVVVYSLQKFMIYLLGDHFKMFTDHYALQYLVNNPMLGEGESIGGFFCSKNLTLK